MVKGNSWITKPVIIEITNKIEIIRNESFIDSLFFNKIKSPKPAFVDKPEIKAPKDNADLIYNITIKTEIAQFGIKPIKDEITTCKYLFVVNSVIIPPDAIVSE